MENDVCHTRRCSGRKWPMGQMCSKCKIHCFSHKLRKICELWKISEKNFFVQICFFQRIFFDKNVFSDNFFSKNFSLLSRTLDYLSDMYRDSLFYLNFTLKIQKCTNFIAFKTITYHYRFE